MKFREDRQISMCTECGEASIVTSIEFENTENLLQLCHDDYDKLVELLG